MTGSYRSFLPYKSVDIYFIYSFALEYQASPHEINNRLDELQWDEGPPIDRKGRPPFLHIKKSLEGRLRARSRSLRLLNERPADITYTEFDRPAEAEHLEPNEELATKESPRSDEFKAKVDAWVRLFDNGSGCITFRVTLDDTLKGIVTFRRIYETLSLSQRLYEKEETFARIRIGRRNGGLFSHFRDVLRHLEMRINGEDQSENAFTDTSYGAAEKLPTPSERPLVFLQDTEIMDLEDNKQDAQNPYVLTVVELDERDVHSHFFQKSATDTLRYKELAAILFRLVYPHHFFRDLVDNLEHVRIPEELLASKSHLKNYAWDSRSLMCFSKTSSLFACLNKERLPAALIKSSLLDVLEIIRSRWHLSILLNAQLDEDLAAFRDQASENNLRVLENLVRRRKRFAAFLHDPLPYIFEGGSVSQVAEVAAAEMQLPKLKQMTIEKFQTLDQLHADQMRLTRLRDFDSYVLALQGIE